MQEKHNGNSRTIHLTEIRVAGFQLIGDTHAAGILRSLMLQGSDVRRIKHHLAAPNFGQGSMVWQATTALS